MPQLCQLWLTCENTEEADKIATALLNKRLVACAKQIPLTARFWWKDRHEHASEILLVMDSRDDLFEMVEMEVSQLHSYETFVLQAIPITRVSKKAAKWLNKELKHE